MLVAAGPVKTGTLRFDPAVARAGQPVKVEYRSNGLFSGFETLRLRGQFPSPESGCNAACRLSARPTELAMLQRDASGVFRGSFVFPAHALLGVFAIEDSAARFIDHAGYVRPQWWETGDQRRPAFWDLMVAGEDGGPSFESLRIRETHWFQYNKERAIETARIMTRLFPDRAESWNQLAYAQARLYSFPTRDDVRNAYRPRFRKLDRDLSSKTSLPAREVSEMFFYAEALQEKEAAGRWKSRLLREHPTDEVAQRLRAQDIRQQHRADSIRFLAEMEKMRSEVGTPTGEMVDIGLQAAHATRDSAAVARWVKLYPESARWRRAISVARGMGRYPAFRAEIMTMLRKEIASADSNWTARFGTEPRGLGMTAAARDSALSRNQFSGIWKYSSLLQLGELLLAEQQYRAALDTLQLAASTRWPTGMRVSEDPRVLAAMARANLSLGDTARAAALAMRATALSSSDEDTNALTDSVRLSLGRFYDEETWRVSVRAIRDTARQKRDSIEKAEARGTRNWKAQVDSARRGLLKQKQ
jgi:hypothetical protein